MKISACLNHSISAFIKCQIYHLNILVAKTKDLEPADTLRVFHAVGEEEIIYKYGI